MQAIIKYLNEILSLIIIILLMGLYGIYIYEYFYNQKEDDPVVESISESSEEIKEEIKDKTFFVEIKGQVNNPDVYEVKEGAVIKDVISLAGGLKNYAYTKNINLSKKIQDEMVIYVYSNSEVNALESKDEKIIECNCPTYDISSCLKDGKSIIVNDSNTTENKLININTALKEELMSLSGIGEAKAASIIDYRNKNGNFVNIEDIKNVSGISENIFEKIKDNITV